MFKKNYQNTVLSRIKWKLYAYEFRQLREISSVLVLHRTWQYGVKYFFILVYDEIVLHKNSKTIGCVLYLNFKDFLKVMKIFIHLLFKKHFFILVIVYHILFEKIVHESTTFFSLVLTIFFPLITIRILQGLTFS